MKNSRKKILALVSFLALALSLLYTTPAVAEISPEGESTWGVYGLETGTQSDAIASHVMAIEQIGNRIYVGGKFLEARANKNSPGVSQPFLAAFDATTGNFISSFNPQIEKPVYALQASPDGSKLFVGGEFRSINSDTEAHGLAALDPITGAVDTTWRSKASNTNGARGVVNELTVHGNHLYVAGRFTHLGGVSRPKHATIGAGKVALATGTADASFSVNTSGGSVWGIAVAPDGSKVYLAGRHSAVDGNAAGGFYSVLNTDGSLNTTLSKYQGNSGPNRVYGQDVVAVGDLVFWGGSEHIIYVFDADTGNLVRNHSTDKGGDYQDIEVVGDRVYASCHCYTSHWADFNYWAAGRPTTPPAGVAITPIKYVAAYSAADGSHIDTFILNTSATQAGVWAIHGASDGCLWVGGDLSSMTTVAGNQRALGGFGKFCEGAAGGGDTQIPATPSELTQTRQEAAKIVIRWRKPFDNVGVTSYEISRDGAVVDTKDSTSGTLWYVDRGLTRNTTYSYSVVALDAAGNRSAAATLDASTVLDPAGPVIDAPEGLRSTNQTRERIVLNWQRVTGATSYIIQKNEGAGFVTIGTKTNRWYTDKPLNAATSASYRVLAQDADGNVSDPSAAIEVSTLP